ncbi:reverse transcriptase [Thalictrum thalictroides]|uniref:Reverse transcriptase n=1 Tax=Thalictrum thalictroides TaxID=46969 RepID=A0A7J6VQP8_THATH|nr:reverse transcriptase [Thalictrum thalictroides]
MDPSDVTMDSPQSDVVENYLLNVTSESSTSATDKADTFLRCPLKEIMYIKSTLTNLKAALTTQKVDIENLIKDHTPGLAKILRSNAGMITKLGRITNAKDDLLLLRKTSPCDCASLRDQVSAFKSAASVEKSDAQTDTELVPSWWLSDGFVATGAATRGRRTKTPRTVDTEAESAMETENENWSAVVRKKAKPKKKVSTEPSQARPAPAARQQPKTYSKKPPAIMIKPAVGKSYSDTVRSVRSCGLTMADLGTSLVMRETQDGSLLMELPRGEKSAAAAKKIASAFSEKLGPDIGRISQLGVLVDVEVLDLDACATADEVLESLRAAVTGEDNASLEAERSSICDVRIWSTKSKQQIASARMPRHLATRISRIPVGYSMCRVRPRTLPPERCFRCQTFGHSSRNCTSAIDRTGACWKCGKDGHGMKNCTEPDDSCLACHLAGHPKVSHKPGSAEPQRELGRRAAAGPDRVREGGRRPHHLRTGHPPRRRKPLGIQHGPQSRRRNRAALRPEPRRPRLWRRLRLALVPTADGLRLLLAPRIDAAGILALKSAESLDAYLTAACDASMPRKRPGPPGKPPVYWWTDNIAALRRDCLAARRRYTRLLRRVHGPDIPVARSTYAIARRALRTAIRVAKKSCWLDLCALVDTDPWGLPYRLVMRKLGIRPPGGDARGRENGIADFLFPAAPITDWSVAPSAAVNNIFEAFDPILNDIIFTRVIPEFSIDELKKAAKRLPAGKATGPSGIPNERARLVLLRKGPDKPPEAPSSYRPICMLDTPGKLLERLLLQRLETHLDAHGGRRRATNQFGFRKGVSTESAVARVLEIAALAASGRGQKDLCILVTLDVKNAFNTLRWPVIDAALRSKNTPEYLVEMFRSWLSDRSLLTGADLAPRPVTCGVPQGSVLGPALWNVSYDGLLEMQVPPGVHLVGFADDLAVIGVARTGPLLEAALNPTLAAIDQWMQQKGLQLAHHKSEAVLLTKRRAFEPPRLEIGGHPIRIEKSLRYLGVILDQRLTFGPHVDTVAKKAARSAAALARLMPNVQGPGQWKRRLLATVVESQLFRSHGPGERPDQGPPARRPRAWRTSPDQGRNKTRGEADNHRTMADSLGDHRQGSLDAAHPAKRQEVVGKDRAEGPPVLPHDAGPFQSRMLRTVPS